MPTFEALDEFQREWAGLTKVQRELFRLARIHFVEDLRSGAQFRRGLRIKRVRKVRNVWELTWDNDGRATWMFGRHQVIPGEPHIIWRRIGDHRIFDRP